MERFVCIHGHFYQPPRENAWLESVEMQDSAYPYHDWNERITDECYAPNTASRILDGEGFIKKIVDNYQQISFNFGPTLLKWLEDEHYDTYEAILAADARSVENTGHGAAISQAYNHLIMPLASRRDKWTQVHWGILDFEHRFGRSPEGMWLPETAVNQETLDIMAEQGIKFTILAPHQAKRVRRLGADKWEDTSEGSVNPRMPYHLNLASGRSIVIFFYDGPIAQAVAFQDLLNSGEKFAGRLIGAFPGDSKRPELVHLATDGETYGHHHRFGDMALAYALDYIEQRGLATITNYAAYLAQHPPTHEVEIIENTSWSCVHGIERWRSNCGCNTGRNSAWNQEWRAPLREALDRLRDVLVDRYQKLAAPLLKDPWAARDDYISVVLDRSRENIHSFMQRNCREEPGEAGTVTVLKLMELQRHAMLMYTSCGWFFDELSGIETVQVIQYAARALQITSEMTGEDLRPAFLQDLAMAKSNLRRYGDGRGVYERLVRPAMIDLRRVAAHFAISSVFEDYETSARIYCYEISVENYQSSQFGRRKLVTGRARVTSVITFESADFTFGVLHLGDHNVNAGVRPFGNESSYQAMENDLAAAFKGGDIPEVIRRLDRNFGGSLYTIRELFRDEQRRVLDKILETSLAEIENAYQQVYDNYYPPMRFISDLGGQVPSGFKSAAEFILNDSLKQTLEAPSLDTARLKELLEEVETWDVELDAVGLSYLMQQALERMMATWAARPDEITTLDALLEAASQVESLPFPVDLWKVQNTFFELLRTVFPGFKQAAASGDAAAVALTERFARLGGILSVRVG